MSVIVRAVLIVRAGCGPTRSVVLDCGHSACWWLGVTQGKRLKCDVCTLRNQRMLDEGRPALVLAFPGGRGTADMVGRASRAGIPVLTPEDCP